jgi:hypothetical protein
MKKNIFNIALFFLAIALFASCEDNTSETLDMSGDVDIHSFVVNGVEGTINAENSTITVILPTGTDLSTLSPQITIADGAQISPKSGEAMDFSQSIVKGNEVTYIVTNKDLYQKYKIVADVARAKIGKFKIGMVEADIDDAQRKITIYLPVGTDVTALIPVVEYTDGATISPADGQPVNFTNPVNYKLTYKGSEFVYEVTVILGNKPVPPLVIYNGEDVVPQWWTVGSAGDISSNFANPKPDVLNATPFCASIWRNPGDDDWTGGGLGGLNIDPAVYNHFTLLVWKEYEGDVQLEIQGDGAGNQWLKVWYSGDALGEWQKLEFTLPEGHGLTKIHTILVAPQITGTKDDPNFSGQRMYWDELIALPK